MTDLGVGFQTQTISQTATINSTSVIDLSIPANTTVLASGIQPSKIDNSTTLMSFHGPHPTDTTKWRFQASVELPYGGSGYPVNITVWMVVGNGSDWYNVKTYGAKADGVTDDHVAIQAAVTAAHAAGGGTVYLPAGSYFVGGRVTPATNVTIQGAGITKTLLTSGVSGDYVFYSKDSVNGLVDFTLRDMTIDVANVTNGSAIRFEYITRGEFQRLRILNVPANGWGAVIGASGTAASTNAYINFNVKFMDCFFDTQNSTLEMLLIMNTQHIEVLNTDFYNNSSSNGPGIGVYQVCDDVKIANCTFRSINGPSVYYSVSTNNVIIDHCAFYGNNTTGTGIQGANVSDNGTFNAGWTYGLTVSNCYFTGLVVGLQISGVKGAAVDNCYFENNYNIGIQVKQGNVGGSATPVYWAVSNCRFRNNNQQNTNALIHPAILLSNIGGNQYGIIRDCSFWDDAVSHTQTCPITFSGAFTWDYINITGCYLEQHQNSNIYQQLFLDSGATLGSHVIISDSRLSDGTTTLVQSGLPGTISSKSSGYTVNATDGTILATGGAGGITITLPAVATVTGQRFTIIKADNGAGAITVATTSSQTINGVTTQSLASQYNKITVQSDGSVWWIINT